jgi:hypothetical protein
MKMILVQRRPAALSQSIPYLWVAVKFEDSIQPLHWHDAKTICKAVQRMRELIYVISTACAGRMHPFVKEKLPHEYASG